MGINIDLNLFISNGLPHFNQASNTNLGNASLDANKNIRPSPKQSPKHEMPVEKEFQRNASIRKSKTGTKNKVIKPSSDPSKLAKG